MAPQCLLAQWNPMINNTTRTLAVLELGLRTDAVHLKELERDLALTLQSARLFGVTYRASDVSNTNWQHQWDNVEARLIRIRLLVNVMNDCVECQDMARLKQALEAWETIQAEDVKLVEALSVIRAHAGGLGVTVRQEWNQLAHKLELHLETIHACAQVLRIKLELRKKHSKAEVDQLVQDVLTQRARAGEMNAGLYQQEFDDAALEIENEQHKYLGFMDVVKSLFMWVETAEERVVRNRSLKVDDSTICALAD